MAGCPVDQIPAWPPQPVGERQHGTLRLGKGGVEQVCRQIAVDRPDPFGRTVQRHETGHARKAEAEPLHRQRHHTFAHAVVELDDVGADRLERVPYQPGRSKSVRGFGAGISRASAVEPHQCDALCGIAVRQRGAVGRRQIVVSGEKDGDGEP